MRPGATASSSKQNLRTTMQRAVLSMSSKKRQSESHAICQHLISCIDHIKPAIICGFLPYSSEPNILPFLEHCIDEGLPVYLPKMKGTSMSFYRAEFRSNSQAKCMDSWLMVCHGEVPPVATEATACPEPDEGNPCTPFAPHHDTSLSPSSSILHAITLSDSRLRCNRDTSMLILVPGRAFDRKGNRLGRGKGMYDRAIRKIRKKKSCRFLGVCFACQLVRSIPCEPHDERVDAIVTG